MYIHLQMHAGTPHKGNTFYLRRARILAAFAIVFLTVFGFTINARNSNSKDATRAVSSAIDSKKSFADHRAVQLYQWRQQELTEAVKDYFNRAIAAGDIIGAGVSIIQGDSILLSEGYGKRKSNEAAAVDGQTIFRLGSLSKGFTGILAAELKSEGKLSWDDKVSDFVPGFQLGNCENTDKITLATILSHTSGAAYHSFTNLVEAGLPLTDIATRFKTVQPIAAPGTVYSYQNALFALSGEMMYKATGQDISCLLESRFFKPLGMCSTTMDHETLLHAGNIAIPHSKRGRQWRPLRLADNYYNAVAAGGINASARDMAEWMRMLLGYHPEVMSSTSLEEAFTPIIEIRGHSKYYQRWPGHIASYYGFGWRIHKFVENGSHQQKTIWHHGGSVNNYRNEIAIYPEAELGICVLLNNNSRLARTVVPDLYQIVQQVYEQSTSNIASNSNPKPIPLF